MEKENIAYKILQNFRNKLKTNESVIGPFMKTCDPAFVEIAGYAGFDFAILDLEHGPGNIAIIQNNIRAALVSYLMPIIRVESFEESYIKHALDIGALGVQVPQINSYEQAVKAIKAARFYPKGERGVCRFVRAANYSCMDQFEYFKKSNEIVLILQIEGQEGIKNLSEILDLENFDILFIGPYDLSQSLGIPGQINHPRLIEQMKYIISIARERNKIIGTFIDKLENIKLFKEIGIQYLSYSVDVGLFSEMCKQVVEAYSHY